MTNDLSNILKKVLTSEQVAKVIDRPFLPYQPTQEDIEILQLATKFPGPNYIPTPEDIAFAREHSDSKFAAGLLLNSPPSFTEEDRQYLLARCSEETRKIIEDYKLK